MELRNRNFSIAFCSHFSAFFHFSTFFHIFNFFRIFSHVFSLFFPIAFSKTILRKFWGWRSPENSEDPQKVWGWGSSKKSDDSSGKSEGSSENFEGSSVHFEESPELFDNHQKVLIYNEKMLIKDQFLLQHISYKVRGCFVLKKHCQYFQRKLRQFSADITSVSSSELSSEVCEEYRTCLRISSEWIDQNFSRNLSRY